MSVDGTKGWLVDETAVLSTSPPCRFPRPPPTYSCFPPSLDF